jgi:hypothetical protein
MKQTCLLIELFIERTRRTFLNIHLNSTFQKPRLTFVGMTKEELEVLSVRPPDPAQIEKLHHVTLASFLATNQRSIHLARSKDRDIFII